MSSSRSGDKGPRAGREHRGHRGRRHLQGCRGSGHRGGLQILEWNHSPSECGYEGKIVGVGAMLVVVVVL